MGNGVRATSPGDPAVVVVTGELDVHSAADLRDVLLRVVAESHGDVVVDLTGATFIDSTGMGVLVAALRRLRALDRRLELAVTDERMLRVLRIAGLSRAFVIHPAVPPSARGWHHPVLQAAHRPGGEAPEPAAGRDGQGGRG